MRIILPKSINFKQIVRCIRRLYLIYLRPEYVKKQLKNRKGKCGMCGCCKTVNCDHFDGRKCMIWETKPLICRISPIDEKDKTEFMKKHCKFKW